MDRQAMIDALSQLGFDVSKINDAVPDEVLSEMLNWVEPVEEEMPAETPPADAAMGDEEQNMLDPEMQPVDPNAVPEEDEEKVDQMADLSPEEMIQALVGKGYAEADLMGLSPEDLKSFYDKEFPPMAPEAAPEVAAMSERRRRAKLSKVSRFAEQTIQRLVNDAVKRIEKKFSPVRNQVSALELNTRRASVKKFCEVQVEAGKLLPAQFKTTYERLMRADNKNKIRVHADGKIRIMTELERQMQELEQSPVIMSFAERLKQPVGTTDGEKAKVLQHFQAFSETYAKTGHTQDKMLKAFEIARNKNPKLSAQDFINGKL